MIIDSHCHLDRLNLNSYNGNLDQALEAARKNDIKHFLCVCIDLENFPVVLNLAERYEEITCSVGLHPSEQDSRESNQDELVQLAKHSKVVAIGETGLDYFHCQGERIGQQDRFRYHIQAAKITKKPLIIHLRDSADDLLSIIKEEGADQVGGVMHCFTEDWNVAKRALDLNFYLSFSGILTFKKAFVVKEVAKRAPLDRILIETDSPYLAPEPKRSKPNEPSFLHYIAKYLAQLRDDTYENIASQTTENFYQLFLTTS